MQTLQKKNGRNLQKPSRKRIADAQKSLLSVAEAMPAFECEFLVNDEKMSGNFLLIEISNTGAMGPGLDLVPSADACDGLFEVVWVRKSGRQELLSYLEHLQKGKKPETPVEGRRCQRLTFRVSGTPLHVDGKVFAKAATPICVTVLQGHSS